ncbi:hypothetical protein SRHO_G00188640 [Serrasalmus rhombeus]
MKTYMTPSCAISAHFILGYTGSVSAAPEDGRTATGQKAERSVVMAECNKDFWCSKTLSIAQDHKSPQKMLARRASQTAEIKRAPLRWRSRRSALIERCSGSVNRAGLLKCPAHIYLQRLQRCC